MPHQADECGARIDGELSGLSLLVLRLPEANLDEFVALEGGVDGAQDGRGDAAIPHLYQGAQRVGASAQEAPLQSRELRGGGHAGSIAPTDDRRHSAQSGWGRVGVSRREVVVAFLERVTGFAVTPAGAALDRFCVRWLGHSLVSWLFARGSGQAYNVPLLLTATANEPIAPRFVEGGSSTLLYGGIPLDLPDGMAFHLSDHLMVHREQDYQAIVTQGPVFDRSTEQLATSDEGVILLRKLVMEGIETAADGRDPQGIRWTSAGDDVIDLEGIVMDDLDRTDAA